MSSTPRTISKFIKEEIENIYPVLTITGPRQSGKTTLVKELYKNKPYINLERLDDREFALNDPERFLQQFPAGAILDEVQRAPELLSYIQVIVDEQKKKNMFILTGSQNFLLLEKITQSLAGRTSLITLLPFSIEEINTRETYDLESHSLEDLIFKGFYPKIYEEKANPRIILEDYIKTYLERDLRDWANIQDLNLFRKFIKMCAARIGQPVNFSNIGDDLGLSHTTIKKWINLLELSYIVYLHPAYSANINKQLVKAPKLYFYDVGLAAHLLDIEKPEQLLTHSLRGSLYENLVIIEFLKFRFNQGKNSNLYFYKDKSKEVDLIYKVSEKLIPIEIKSSQRVKDEFFKSLEYFKKLFSNNVEEKYLVYAGDQEQNRNQAFISNYKKILNHF